MLAAGVVDSFARLNPTQMVLLALTIAALTLLMGSTRRRIRASRRQSSPSVRERYRELEQDQLNTRDAQQAILELDQVARGIHGRLDTKIAKLERLIRDADARIAKLTSIRPAPIEPHSLDITLGDASSGDSPAQPSNIPPEHQRIYQLADEGCAPPQIAARTNRLAGEVELILSLRRARQERPATANGV